MKIAILHYGEDLPGDPGYRPLRYGRFAKDWAAAGHEVVRIAPSFSHLRRSMRTPGEQTSSEGRCVVVRTSGYDTTQGLLRLVFLLRFAVGSAVACRRERPDVVVAGYPPPFQIGLLRALGVRSPIVADVRDIWFDHRIPRARFSRALVSVLSWLARSDLRRASAVLALSEDMASWTGIEHAHVAPIGVVEVANDSSVEAATGPLEFVFVGTLTPSFALLEMIEAWPPEANAVRLTIAGDGPLKEDIERLSAMNPNVRYIGRIPSDKVPALLARSDVGLAPTVAGFGTTLSNKVCEYLAYGLYVLHSLEPGPSNDLSEHDLGSEYSSSAVAELDRNRQHVRRGCLARASLAVEKFGAPAIGLEVLVLLENLLEERAKG